MLKVTVVLTWLASMALADANCTISILNEKYSGEKIRLTFHSTLNSKSECETLARMHRPNLATREIRRKSVTFRWMGNSGVAGSPKPSTKKY